MGFERFEWPPGDKGSACCDVKGDTLDGKFWSKICKVITSAEENLGGDQGFDDRRYDDGIL